MRSPRWSAGLRRYAPASQSGATTGQGCRGPLPTPTRSSARGRRRLLPGHAAATSMGSSPSSTPISSFARTTAVSARAGCSEAPRRSPVGPALCIPGRGGAPGPGQRGGWSGCRPPRAAIRRPRIHCPRRQDRRDRRDRRSRACPADRRNIAGLTRDVMPDAIQGRLRSRDLA